MEPRKSEFSAGFCEFLLAGQVGVGSTWPDQPRKSAANAGFYGNFRDFGGSSTD
jgi:hypothetical protein